MEMKTRYFRIVQDGEKIQGYESDQPFRDEWDTSGPQKFLFDYVLGEKRDIDKLRSALETIASFWDDSTTDHQMSGAMYDARCLALNALAGDWDNV